MRPRLRKRRLPCRRRRKRPRPPRRSRRRHLRRTARLPTAPYPEIAPPSRRHGATAPRRHRAFDRGAFSTRSRTEGVGGRGTDGVVGRAAGAPGARLRVAGRPRVGQGAAADSPGWLGRMDSAQRREARPHALLDRRGQAPACGSVYRSGSLVRSFQAVIGKPATPTPTGLAAVYEVDRQPDPEGFLGTWALPLTILSHALFNFGGGPGRIAIHGRGGASLLDPLGSARSHGCIRIDDTDVGWLGRRCARAPRWRSPTEVGLSSGHEVRSRELPVSG